MKKEMLKIRAVLYNLITLIGLNEVTIRLVETTLTAIIVSAPQFASVRLILKIIFS